MRFHAPPRLIALRARARNAIKRGGAWNRMTLNEGTAAAPEAAVDVEALDQALARLAEHDADQARLVELRYFGGLTIEETADVLGVSPATVKRSWMVARAWLKKELGGP